MLLNAATPRAVDISSAEHMRCQMPLRVLSQELIAEAAQISWPLQFSQPSHHVGVDDAPPNPQKMFLAVQCDSGLQRVGVLPNGLGETTHECSLFGALRELTR